VKLGEKRPFISLKGGPAPPPFFGKEKKGNAGSRIYFISAKGRIREKIAFQLGRDAAYLLLGNSLSPPSALLRKGGTGYRLGVYTPIDKRGGGKKKGARTPSSLEKNKS